MTEEKTALPILDAVPQIDRLEVVVLVDNTHLALVPDLVTGDVAIERYRFPIEDEEPGRTVQSEFGLSLLLRSWQGDAKREVLFDFSYSAPALNMNADLLGLDPSALAAMVFTHGIAL